ncbi:hypothetical protein ACOZDZ_02400 [Streptomyces griseoincarnatus]
MAKAVRMVWAGSAAVARTVGGVDADGGVGVSKRGQDRGGGGGDRGSGGGHRPAGRVAGHLVAVVVVGIGGVALGIVAVEEEFLARGDALVPGTGGAGEDCEGGGAVWVVGVDGEGNEVRHGEGSGGPAVVGAQAPQHTRRVHDRFAASAQEGNRLPDVVPMGEVAPRDGIQVQGLSRLGQDAGHRRPHVERTPENEARSDPCVTFRHISNVGSVRQFTSHPNRRIPGT